MKEYKTIFDTSTEEILPGIQIENSDEEEEKKQEDSMEKFRDESEKINNTHADPPALQLIFPVDEFEKIIIPGDGYCMVQSVLETLQRKKINKNRNTRPNEKRT